MRVTSFNANGIRAAARKGFFDWFASQSIDFLCVQETKAQAEQIWSNHPECLPDGYYIDFSDAEKKGYSGVAIYAKKTPNRVIKTLGIDWADREGRYIQFDYDDLSIASLYLPSGSSGEQRQAYKMDFLSHYRDLLAEQIKQNRSMIICGDFNIVHKAIDIKNWKQNQKTSGVLPEERAWLDEIFDQHGWVDAFRAINQQPDQYTWWSNRGRAREKNVGWRIDYHIVTPDLAPMITRELIYKGQWFSDHAPLTIDYDDRA